MSSGPRYRQGKVSGGQHHRYIQGLSRLIQSLADWPEIHSIHMGPVKQRHVIGRGQNRQRVVGRSKDERGSPTGDWLLAPKGRKNTLGGGLTFRATRFQVKGSIVTGIRCVASQGSHSQDVTLNGPCLEALKRRLQDSGYGADW